MGDGGWGMGDGGWGMGDGGWGMGDGGWGMGDGVEVTACVGLCPPHQKKIVYRYGSQHWRPQMAHHALHMS